MQTMARRKTKVDHLRENVSNVVGSSYRYQMLQREKMTMTQRRWERIALVFCAVSIVVSIADPRYSGLWLMGLAWLVGALIQKWGD